MIGSANAWFRIPRVFRVNRRDLRFQFLFVLLFLTNCAVISLPAQSTTNQSASVSRNGSEYVSVTQWAKANDIHLHWIVKERELRATNATTQIHFMMNSRNARINGINFVLSFPVILENGRILISLIDLRATLHPILFPAKLPVGAVQTICLDAGHGGKDPGNLEGTMQEKRYALLLAQEVEALLKNAGFKVIQTREQDAFVELAERPKSANNQGADLFVSLHYNAAANRNAQGVETYCLTPQGASSSNGGIGSSLAPAYPGTAQNAKNVLLAYHVQKSMVTSLKTEDRGVKRSQFVVLSSPKMPAILIEAGFMTSANDAKRIDDPAYRKKTAVAIVNGILAYKRAVER